MTDRRGDRQDGQAGAYAVEPCARFKAVHWMIAALSTIELRIMEYTINEKFEADRTWSAERRPVVRGDLDARLLDLQARLGDGLWLEADGFTIGDLIMVSVLGGLRGTGVLEQFPGLAA